MKLHLGCGPVYLDGWINIDICIDGYTWLAIERPDIMNYNKTTLNNYYKYSWGEREHNLAVVDKFMNISKFPYPYDDNSVDEILIIGTFEHFDKDEGIKLLKEWHRILKPDRRVIIDVPDMVETMRYLEGNPEWAIRLIYGSQKNKYAFHKWGYTLETLSDTCKEIGFKITNEINLVEHGYPMFTIEAIK